MFYRRHFAAAPTRLLLAASLLFLLIPAVQASAKETSESCDASAKLAVLVSPLSPWKGASLRVVFAVEKPLQGELSLIAPDGSVALKSRERRGGPPYFWFAEIAKPVAGTWRATLISDDAAAICSKVTREIVVGSTAKPASQSSDKSVWPVRDSWNRKTENLYSAWIEKLFDAPLDEAPSWAALHEVLRNQSRNFLFDHLGLGEDRKGLIIRPDCADLPYFLRAYFAFKMGLPFGYSKCSRGGGGKPPRCPQWWNIQKEEPGAEEQKVADAKPGLISGIFGDVAAKPSTIRGPSRPAGLVSGFGYYLRTTVANAVHSGAGRTAADDNKTDYYPVALKEDTLRPGTIYADPYGHVLVLVKRIAQTSAAAGVFLAVDGQPDGTVARKRFWRGNFLFAQDPGLGSPGFKRFRPIVADKNGGLRRLANAEIANEADYGDFSLEQSKLSVEAFYDRMDDVMSPAPLDPLRAMQEAITALEEQVKARVTSVENGRKYQNGGGAEVAIPNGASIFETTGAWEDFSTPSRDLRLLIAIDVVRGFPDRVARRPERYAMPAGKSVADVKAELDRTLASELATRKFAYLRSDGSQWPLALKDVVERTAELEMAYNVNDCVELRWGAPDKGDEASTCKRRASGAQRQKMAEYRPWFHERRRPARN
ncbi:hypothetical protein HYPDE_39218 [Hyphomicrobium denitrificans 1NES1]|uniref:Uncharacterized protein n=1 Tax=Hyphomicrobium denitrificans 1NES1 TaxID=670307 RepID=N0B911_9HYPH|nr:hypothetical protein [Hyphomicrobium denitrificans]AGK59513.1 hypothetical protein HYPDE_39218 [Hyphomicrobium denitrificans 1NES1]